MCLCCALWATLITLSAHTIGVAEAPLVVVLALLWVSTIVYFICLIIMPQVRPHVQQVVDTSLALGVCPPRQTLRLPSVSIVRAGLFVVATAAYRRCDQGVQITSL